MQWKNAIIALLCILLILSTCTSFFFYQDQQRTIENLREIIEEKEDIIKEYASKENKPDINSFEKASFANIVAVRSDDASGVIGKVRVEIKGGSGRVLINTNPFVESDTQYSIREAVKVAESFTGENISNKDIVISFDINGTLIGGPSAGAAISVATIAAMVGKKVREDAVITGTIEEGGIGKVGGIFEKAVAAEEEDVNLFIVPKGQKKLIYYEKRIEEKKIGWFTMTRIYYMPKEIDLEEYMMGKMEVEEVSTISEAVSHLIFT